MIVSRDNRRLKDMRRLRRCKDAERLLIEGPHLLAEALAAGLEIEYVLATPEFLADRPSCTVLERLARPPIEVDGRLLEELADADSPRGLLAVAHRGVVDPAGLPRPRAAAPVVFAEGLQDPGNLGALARSAGAAGAAAMILAPGTVHPHHPRALRASAGSLFHLQVAREVGIEALTEEYSAPVRRVALVAHGGVDLYQADLDGPLLLLVGAEGPGLSTAAAGTADLRLTIPLDPAVESLNTAVAAAVVLFEIRRRGR